MRCTGLTLFLVLVVLFAVLMGRIDASPQSQPGHGSGSHRPPAPVSKQKEDYYSVLGVDRSASEKDIRNAYRKKAMKLHPDKGGDEAQFKTLVEAYEVLIDADKRRVYDHVGHDGLHSTAQGDAGFSSAFFGDMRDLFRGFAHAVPLVYNLELSLEDFFTGRRVSVTLGGQRFDIDIAPGVLEGVELRAELKDERGQRRDVVFVLQEKAHSLFVRKGADLLVDLHINLVEALTGFERTIKQLNGEELQIKSKEGVCLQPGALLCVEGHGMPRWTRSQSKSGAARGDLFLRINIKMPETLSTLSNDDKEALMRMLGCKPQPAPVSSSTKAAAKVVIPRKANPRSFGMGSTMPNEDFGHFFFQ